MPVAAPIIGAVGAIGGGLLASGASKSAANAQTQAADTAAQTQWDIANLQAQLQAPYRQGGIAAENQLLTLLGIDPNAGQPSNTMTAASPYGVYGVPTGYVVNAMAPGTGLGSQYASGLNVDTSSPLFGKYGPGTSFTMQDFYANQDPGYGFRLDQGLKALNQSMAAKGLGISGANIKGAQQYGQDLASQEYQNAFNRYQVNRSNALNPLQSLMGASQTAANTMTGALGQAGQNVSDLQTQAGNARASGYIGSSNALNQGIGQAANYFANAFTPSPATYNPYSYTPTTGTGNYQTVYNYGNG